MKGIPVVIVKVRADLGGSDLHESIFSQASPSVFEADLPSNMSILFWLRIRESLFCSRLRYMSLSSSGSAAGSQVVGIHRYCPVSEGVCFFCRYKWATTAARFAPALIPPTMNPFPGSMSSSERLSRDYIRIESINASSVRERIQAHPKHRIFCIFNSSGKWILRSKPICYIDCYTTKSCPASTQRELIVAVPEAKSTPMEENHAWHAIWRMDIWTVNAHCDRTAITSGNLAIGLCVFCACAGG